MNEYLPSKVRLPFGDAPIPSGIDESTVPAASVITGEGADLGAGPVQVADRAGNISSASVSGVENTREK